MNIQKLSLVKKSIIGIVGLIVFFVFIVWLINLEVFDEEPSEGVQRVLQSHKMPTPSKNAVVYLFGLTSSNELSPLEAGEKLIGRIFQNREKLGSDELTDADYKEILGGLDLEKSWIKSIERCRSRTEYGCLEKLSQQFNDFSADGERLNIMLSRYQRLLSFKEYVSINKFSFNTPIPAYVHPMTLQQLTTARLYHLKDFEGLTDQLIRDIEFWRMILDGQNMLIDKMVAIAALWNDIQYISEGLRENIFDPIQQEKLMRSLSDLTQDELDISESFVLEARAMYNHLQNLGYTDSGFLFESNSWLLSMLIQTGATNNSHYELFLKPIIELSKLNSYDFFEALPNGASKIEEPFKLSLSPSNLYNLGGRILLTQSGWMASDYVARVHDLNGMLGLVRLQMEIGKQPTQSAVQLIGKSSLRNPYQDKPMDYDAEENWLGFDCMNKESSCRIKL